MGLLILYGLVAMIISYYIQKVCFVPKQTVVRVLLSVLHIVVIGVVGASCYQYSHGQDAFLFNNARLSIFAAALILIFYILVIVGMITGVTLAWIVYAIKWYRANKESDVDEGDEYYEESAGSN